MIVRLLTILAVTLPLAACAAQPAAPTAAAQPAHAGDAAPAPASPSAPAAPAAAAPAGQADAGTAAQPAAQNTPAQPTQPARAAAGGRQAPSGNAAPGRAAPGTTPAATAETDTPAAGAPGVATPGVATPSTPTTTTTTTTPAPAPVPMQSGSPTGNLMQTLFALILVLAVLAALAWFLKRYGPRAGVGAAANLRVVGSLSLGGRERLLVVEVGNQWIVVGASPGRVNALATMPKQDAAAGNEGAALAPHGPAANSFADWLRQTMDKRK